MGLLSSVRGIALAGAIVVSGLGAGWVGPAASAQEELVFCSDIAYPPMESYEGSEAVGADIDIGDEIAARLGGRRSTPTSGSTLSSPRSSATNVKRLSPA